MRIIACYSAKGGVGTSTLAVNLAYGFAQAGARTLLCDFDAQGASSFYLRFKRGEKKWATKLFNGSKKLLQRVKASDYELLDVLPAQQGFASLDHQLHQQDDGDKCLAQLLQNFAPHYDVLLVDCPSGEGAFSQALLKLADQVVIPVTPTPLSVRSFQLTMAQLQPSEQVPQRQISAVFSQVQPQKKLHQQQMMQLLADYPALFMPQVIPWLADIEQMASERAPVAVYNRKLGDVFSTLWQQLVA